MENLGKREAILAGSKLIRQLAQQAGHPLRVLELGCGEGQVIGPLVDAHAQLCAGGCVVGVDYNARSLARCRKDYPFWRFVEGDFTDPALLGELGEYDVLLLVNALHEVFSASYSAELGEVDEQIGKQRVETALGAAAACLASGGWLVLFDGMEPPSDPQERLHIRFQDLAIRQDFERFASQYQPFRITYHETGDRLEIVLSRRDFTRYITKSIFLRKPLWQTEQKESYQYFTEAEFRAAFARQGLQIVELRTLTVNSEKWSRLVQICTPQVDFPQEHILILAQRSRSGKHAA